MALQNAVVFWLDEVRGRKLEDKFRDPEFERKKRCYILATGFGIFRINALGQRHVSRGASRSQGIERVPPAVPVQYDDGNRWPGHGGVRHVDRRRILSTFVEGLNH